MLKTSKVRKITELSIYISFREGQRLSRSFFSFIWRGFLGCLRTTDDVEKVHSSPSFYVHVYSYTWYIAGGGYHGFNEIAALAPRFRVLKKCYVRRT